jgi:two-component system cell cycle response regulator
MEKTFTQRRMALRVLLADESTTIKKVMQLALQDFAVEVKAVHAGIDVLEVARSFRPDIIFADVLLQKKNGYEVAGLVKNDPELRSIPVVLMWSSFMDLDDAQARSSGAEGRLEKPFDVETLRKQVLELVPKTRSQRLAHFLEFSPQLNEELKGDASVQQARKGAIPPTVAPLSRDNTTVAPSRADSKTDKSTWSMESFDDPSNFEAPLAANHENDEADHENESFQPLELSQLSEDFPARSSHESRQELSHDGVPAGLKLDTADESMADDEAWARQDLSQFKLDLPPISVGEGRDEFKVDMGEEEFSMANFETEQAPIPKPASRASAPPPAGPGRRSPAREIDHDEALSNDLTLGAHQINEAEHEVALPLEPLEIDEPLEFTTAQAPSASAKSPLISSPTFGATSPAGINQMSAEHLESIIRAQSREIIEQVVRRLVPDLATTIIREELERLLTDTTPPRSTPPEGKDSRL